MSNNIEAGTIAYDLAQKSPVIIVDEDIGAVGDLPQAKRELVQNSAGNKAIGFDSETRVANVTYFDMQSVNDSVYAFPHTRLGVPLVEIGDHEFTPRQFVLYTLVRDVLAEAVREGSDSVSEMQSLFDAVGAYDEILDAALAEVDQDLDSYTDT